MVEMYDKVALLLLLFLLLLDSVLGGAARVRGGGVALRGGGEGVVPPAVGIPPLTPHFLLAAHKIEKKIEQVVDIFNISVFIYSKQQKILKFSTSSHVTPFSNNVNIVYVDLLVPTKLSVELYQIFFNCLCP